METTQTVAAGDLSTFTFVEGDGPPVVMLHGMAATADCWMYARDSLRRRFRVVAPDLPGHGRSTGGLRRYSLSFFSAWLDGFLDALRLPAITLVGHSMGGAISLAYALARPDRVQALVLVDALGVGHGLPWGVLRRVIGGLPHLLMAGLTRRDDPYLFRFFQPWVYLDPWGPPRLGIERMVALNQPHLLGTIWAGVRLLLADFVLGRGRIALAERQPEIAVPTLIVWGLHDGLLPVARAYEGAARIPNAQLAIIERSAHEPMLEQPETFNASVFDFLSRIAIERGEP